MSKKSDDRIKEEIILAVIIQVGIPATLAAARWVGQKISKWWNDDENE